MHSILSLLRISIFVCLVATKVMHTCHNSGLADDNTGSDFGALAPRSPRPLDEEEDPEWRSLQRLLNSHSQSGIAEAPRLRSRPAKEGEPNIQDIPLHLRYQVLEWTMQDQRRQQDESRKKALEAEAAAKQLLTAERVSFREQAKASWNFPEVSSLIHESEATRGTVKQYKAEAKAARTKIRDIGIDIGSLGSVNTNLRQRMQSMFKSQPNPRRRIEVLGTTAVVPTRHGIGVRTVRSGNQKIKARSDQTHRPEFFEKSSQSSIPNVPVHQREQVLQWAMIEQRKKQNGFRAQTLEAKVAAHRSEEEEFRMMQKYHGTHNEVGKKVARFLFMQAEEGTERHVQAADNARKSMKEPGMMMETVGMINKEMRTRMRKSFPPLPNPERRVKNRVCQPFSAQVLERGLQLTTTGLIRRINTTYQADQPDTKHLVLLASVVSRVDLADHPSLMACQIRKSLTCSNGLWNIRKRRR